MFNTSSSFSLSIVYFIILLLLSVIIMYIALLCFKQKNPIIEITTIAVLLLCLLISTAYLAFIVKVSNELRVGLFNKKYEQIILELQPKLNEEIVENIGILLLRQKEFLESVASFLSGRMSDEDRERIIEKIGTCCKEYGLGLENFKLLIGQQNQMLNSLNFLKGALGFYDCKQEYDSIVSIQGLLLNVFDRIQHEQEKFFTYLKLRDPSVFPEVLPSIFDMLHPAADLLRIMGRLKKVDCQMEFQAYCQKKYKFNISETLQQEVFLRNQLANVLVNGKSLTERITEIKSDISCLDMDINDFKKKCDLFSRQGSELRDTFFKITKYMDSDFREEYSRLQKLEREIQEDRSNENLAKLHYVLLMKLPNVIKHNQKYKQQDIQEILSSESEQIFDRFADNMKKVKVFMAEKQALSARIQNISSNVVKPLKFIFQERKNGIIDILHEDFDELCKITQPYFCIDIFTRNRVYNLLSCLKNKPLFREIKDIISELKTFKYNVSRELEVYTQIQEKSIVVVLAESHLKEILDSVDLLIEKVQTFQVYDPLRKGAFVLKDDGVYQLVGNVLGEKILDIELSRVVDVNKPKVIEDSFMSMDKEYIRTQELVANLGKIYDFLEIKLTTLNRIAHVEASIDNLFSDSEIILKVNHLLDNLTEKLNRGVSSDLKTQICDSMNNLKKILPYAETLNKEAASEIPYQLTHEELENILGQLNNAETVGRFRELLNDFFNCSNQIMLQQVLSEFQKNEDKLLLKEEEVRKKYEEFNSELCYLKGRYLKQDNLHESLQELTKLLSKCRLEELQNDDKMEELKSLFNKFCEQEPQLVNRELVVLLDEFMLKNQEAKDQLKELELQRNVEEGLRKLSQRSTILDNALDEELKDQILSSIQVLKDKVSNPTVKENLDTWEEMIPIIYKFSKDLEQEYEDLQQTFYVVVQKSKALFLETFPNIEKDINNVKNAEQLKEIVEQVIEQIREGMFASARQSMVREVEFIISNLDDMINFFGELKPFIHGDQSDFVHTRQSELQEMNSLKSAFIEFKEILGKEEIQSEDQEILSRVSEILQKTCQGNDALELTNVPLIEEFKQLNSSSSVCCSLLYSMLRLNCIVTEQGEILEGNIEELMNKMKKGDHGNDGDKEKVKGIIRELLLSLHDDFMYYPSDLEKLKDIKAIFTYNYLGWGSTELIDTFTRFEHTVNLIVKYINTKRSMKDLSDEISEIEQSIDVKYGQRKSLERILKYYEQRIEQNKVPGQLNEYLEQIKVGINAVDVHSFSPVRSQ